MSCYICGRHIEEVRLDARDMKTRPCMTCETIISETATETLKEKRIAADDEFRHLSLPDYLDTKRKYDVE